MENIAAYCLLKSLSKQKKDVVPVWYDTYRSCFSKLHVPILDQFDDTKGNPTIVHINKEQAIKYLKEKYNFYTTEELHQKLEQVAGEIDG